MGLQVGAGEGRPIDEVTQVADLVRLLRTFSEDKMSAEITLPDGKVYLATASTVKAEGRLVGRVCILRDVTHFKELDALKSEFVSTVSHDLRSPSDADARLRHHAGDGGRAERAAERLRAQDRHRCREHDPPGEQPARPGPH